MHLTSTAALDQADAQGALMTNRFPSYLARTAFLFGLLVGAPAFLMAACGGEESDASGSTTTGGGDPCLGGVLVDGVCTAKCDPAKCLENNTCVANTCELTCDSHRDCFGDGSQDCAPAIEDDTNAAITTCQFNGKGAGVGLACPFGPECADPGVWNAYACPDGTKCDPAAPNCASGACQALTCTGQGEGDADAYCTSVDCTADSDCPGGFYCELVRVCDPADPREPCLDPSAFADNGAGTLPGPAGGVRNMCIKRAVCAPCETDLDCSQVDGQICADQGGTKVCAARCAKESDCAPGYGCDAAAGACLHKFGSCAGTGKFCEPCQNDLDCGPADGSVYCFAADNGAGCFDASFPDTCTTDADCPLSPSGKHGTCLDSTYVDPSSSVYQHCYVPIDDNTYKTGCW